MGLPPMSLHNSVCAACVDVPCSVGTFGYQPNKPPEGQNIITTTRSHGTRAVVLAVDACEPTEVLRVGGAGHKVRSVVVVARRVLN